MTARFAILIPTLNEAALLGATLAAARRAFGDNAEYIVSDGGSHDMTAQIAVAAGARLLRRARGRGAQLNAALLATRADICILLHADTLLPPDAEQHINAALQRAVAGAFRVRFENNQRAWLARAINLRSVLFRLATGDQAMFAHRTVLNHVGGVPTLELFEDVRLWKQLKRAGRVQLVPAEVTTSARLFAKLGTWRGILLHLRLRLLYAFGVAPHRLARMYPNAGS